MTLSSLHYVSALLVSYLIFSSLSIFGISKCHAFTIRSTTNTLQRTSSPSIRSGTIQNVLMEGYQGMDVDEFESEGENEPKPKQKPIRRQRRSKKIPLIAIVGRPNVGKCCVFVICECSLPSSSKSRLVHVQCVLYVTNS